MPHRRTARGLRFSAVACSAVLVLTAGCSAEIPPEVVAQNIVPPVTDPDADDADGVDPNPDAFDADDDALGPCTVVDDGAARWVATEGEQKAKRAVFEVLDERFPRDVTKKEPHGPLHAGFIGIAVDRPAREYVAVVDAALIDVQALDAKLKAAADAEHARRPKVSKVKIRAQAGCHSVEELLDAQKRIPGIIRPHPGQIGWYVSAYDSRIHISMDPAAPAAAELRERLGDLISFED